ncbi:MAG: hypothetical protein NZM31_12100 [Gemmatales bacterium]|nr:hypothetical protein [Gemmatales bacterium]MDW8387737.1 hypothetical protein [Gemmatales bacterium]
MCLILFTLMLQPDTGAAASKSAGVVELPRTILADQPWYQQAPEPEIEFEGKLDYQPGDGRIGIPPRYGVFRIIGVEEGKPISRRIYTEDRDHLLAPLVGRRVRMVGKVVSRDSESGKSVEFWPGRVIADLGVAGEAIGEIKVFARTSRWLPAKRGVQPQMLVIRDAATLAQVSGMAGGGAEAAAEKALCQLLETKPGVGGISSIDWKKQMLLVISGGVQPMGGARVEVTRLTLQEKGLDVYWKLMTQPGGVGLPPTETLLVPRFEGEIRFFREGVKEPIVVPAVGK